MKWILITTILFSSICLASEKAKYNFSWLDPDKEVYVLQNRKFRKKNNLSLSLLGGLTVSEAFTSSKVAQFRSSYFFTENWGVELLYSKNWSDSNDTFMAVGVAGAIPYVRKMDSYFGGMLAWSPFYAKINTFNKIFYFDWIFGVGFASVKDFNNASDVGTTPRAVETQLAETNTGLVWEAGMRFYVSQNWSIRVNLTTLHYKATRVLPSVGNEDVWFNNYDLLTGLNFTF